MECIFRQETGYSCIARRHNSLSSSDRLLAFGFIAVVSMVIALAFAWLGAWLILPFAGIELVLIVWVARYWNATRRITSVSTIKGKSSRWKSSDADAWTARNSTAGGRR
jgi:uncharacterized membrane protein